MKRWSFEKCASSCLKNESADGWINHRDYGFRVNLIKQTAYLSAFPPPLTSALLRLDSMFDPPRKDPRFQKLVPPPCQNRVRHAADACCRAGCLLAKAFGVSAANCGERWRSRDRELLMLQI